MTIRVGVVGAGAIAQMGHLPHYRDHKEVNLVAIADLSETRARETAAKFGASRWYTSAHEMFTKEQLDAVSICTANHSHVPLTREAISHGLDVLVEKPLATDLQAVETLVQEAERGHRICMVGMTHRFRNEAQALKRFIDGGDLGQVYAGSAKILRRRGTPTGWFTDKSFSGGGPLMDIGVHALDLAWWLAGMPEAETVSGHLVQGIGRYKTDMASRWTSLDSRNQNNAVFDVEDYASAYIRFHGGFVLHLEVSWALNGPQDDGVKIDLFGTRGGVSLEPLVYYTEQNHIFIESNLVVEKNDPYKDEIAHFINAVQSRKEPLVPLKEGSAVVRMLNAILQSSQSRREVLL